MKGEGMVSGTKNIGTLETNVFNSVGSGDQPFENITSERN